MVQFIYPKNFMPGYCSGNCIYSLPLGGWIVNGILSGEGKGVRLLVRSDGGYEYINDSCRQYHNALCNFGVENYFIGLDGRRSDERVDISRFRSSEKYDLIALGDSNNKEIKWIRRSYGSGERDVLVLFYDYETREARGLSFSDLAFNFIYAYSLSCDGLSGIVLGSSIGGCIVDNPLV
jgi:hypothetical protein